MQEALQQIIDRQNLTSGAAFDAMEFIMSGQASDAQIAAFLVGLRMKGETAAEIAGCARSMRKNALPVQVPPEKNAIDLVGTGGDGKHTINISTLAALVAAGAGATVAKHGNRSVSSKCGSADVLKALNVRVDLNHEQMSRCLQETGIAFLFAPALHPAMKHAIGPRREIGVRSVFNILGPITNPAGVRRQLIGVYEKSLLRLLAEVLLQLDAEHVLLVHSDSGMDEISVAEPTHVAELRNGDIRMHTLSAADFGISPAGGRLAGGEAQENAAIARRVLQGEAGLARDTVIANAAAGLYVAGLAPDLRAGAALAAESLDSGAALQKLEALIGFTNGLP